MKLLGNPKTLHLPKLSTDLMVGGLLFNSVGCTQHAANLEPHQNQEPIETVDNSAELERFDGMTITPATFDKLIRVGDRPSTDYRNP